MRYLEQSKSQRQEVEWWLPGAEGRREQGSYGLMSTEFAFREDEKLLEMVGVDGS